MTIICDLLMFLCSFQTRVHTKSANPSIKFDTSLAIWRMEHGNILPISLNLDRHSSKSIGRKLASTVQKPSKKYQDIVNATALRNATMLHTCFDCIVYMHNGRSLCCSGWLGLGRPGLCGLHGTPKNSIWD